MSGGDLYVARLKLKKYHWELAGLLSGEDRYRDIHHKILRRDQHMSEERISEEYGTWESFCGGGQELNMAVTAAANAVQEASRHTGAEIPDFFAGPWPGAGFNASTRATEYGNVVYIDAPLLFAVRAFAQQISSCLPELVEGTEEGPAWVRARGELDHMLRQHALGVDVRATFPVRAMPDPEIEQSRRNMIWGALCYIVAHEAGHLAACRPWDEGWKADNQEFQVRALMDAAGKLQPPHTEEDAGAAHNSEAIADSIGCTVLRREEFFESSGPAGKLPFILGAMSVSQLQAAAWWRRAAETDEPLGWTHPAWDLRYELVRTELSRPQGASSPNSVDVEEARAAAHREPSALEEQAVTAGHWIDGLLDVPQARTRALQRGLSNRGLNPASLVYLQVAHGAGIADGSDILKGLRSRSSRSSSAEDSHGSSAP